MRDLLDTYKPAAAARVHLLLAAMMWTTVGALLLYFGLRWTFATRTPGVWLFAVAAVAVGLLKGWFVLDRTAVRMIGRIQARGDGRCIGGFLSWRSWALVALMAGGGRLLRGGLLPRTVVGLLYVAVGIALLTAARRLWLAWHVLDRA